jgi:hypothetical protein
MSPIPKNVRLPAFGFMQRHDQRQPLSLPRRAL